MKENGVIFFNDFKEINDRDKKYLFDIEQGKIIEVDKRTLLLSKNSGLNKNGLYRKVDKYFSNEEFEDVLKSMEEAKFLKHSNPDKEEEVKFKCDEDIVGITLMLVQGCNLACKYCFGDEGNYNDTGKMSKETAFKAVDYLIKHTEEKKVLITFFGGEPLLALDLIKDIIEYTQDIDRDIQFAMTTNGTLINDEVIEMISKHKISTIISIDGDEHSNNINRYYKDGRGSYNDTISKTDQLRAEGKVSARATLSRDNLDIINVFEHLNSLNFKNIPIAPANNMISNIEYLDFIKNNMDYVDYIEKLIHKKEYDKVKKSTFIYSMLIALHFGTNREYGCGAGIRDIAIDIHGDIYPCHRFVSHKETKIGNIFDDYEINQKERIKYLQKTHISNFKKLKRCESCWIKKFCVGGCVSENYESNGSFLEQSNRECYFKQCLYEKVILLYTRLNDEDKKGLFGE